MRIRAWLPMLCTVDVPRTYSEPFGLRARRLVDSTAWMGSPGSGFGEATIPRPPAKSHTTPARSTRKTVLSVAM